jgi:hypothetical protein
MMCPHCGSELELNPSVTWHVDGTGKPATGKSLCCGKGVTLYLIKSFRAEKYTGPSDVDDWGKKYES